MALSKINTNSIADDAVTTATVNPAQTDITSTGTLTSLNVSGDVSLDGGDFVFNESSADKNFRIESNGNANMFVVDGGNDNVGIGVSPESTSKLEINAGSDGAVGISCRSDGGNGNNRRFNIIPFASGNGTYGGGFKLETRNNSNVFGGVVEVHYDGTLYMGSMNNVLSGADRYGVNLYQSGVLALSANQEQPLYINRENNDGDLVRFFHDRGHEGTISVLGTTVTYGAFTGSHWSRLTDNSKSTILKGTVVETIDEMCDWYQAEFTVTEKNEEGTDVDVVKRHSIALPSGKKVGDTISYTVPDDVSSIVDKDLIGKTYSAKIVKETDIKHTKCKVSDTVDCTNVYGVFLSWDEDDLVNDMNIAALGTYVVRIHKDQTVSKGDLLSSNGDGTAKVQDDDIIRSKTIGKVLTNIKQETYSDGSYTVPCALYCG